MSIWSLVSHFEDRETAPDGAVFKHCEKVGIHMNLHGRKYSKEQINRSGSYLAQKDINLVDEIELDNHWEVFNYWRSLHAYVMNVIYVNLKRRVSKMDITSVIIAQRLKRAPSILSKLNRFPKMQLSRMQDIAGVRIIVKDIPDIYKVRDNIYKQFPHDIYHEKNYINEPKSDGYRSLHITFKVDNLTKTEFNGLNVELQIRTKLQHQWATAVEIIGLYKKESYKSGLGDDKTREFLCLCSNLFAISENTPIDEKYHNKNKNDLCKDLKKLNEELKVLDYLSGLTVFADKQKQIIKNKKIEFCLILLKLDERRLNVSPFDNIEEAKKSYAILEKEIAKSKKNWDVVLISIDDIKALKKAYPNYYLDSKEFVQSVAGFIKRVAS